MIPNSDADKPEGQDCNYERPGFILDPKSNLVNNPNANAAAKSAEAQPQKPWDRRRWVKKATSPMGFYTLGLLVVTGLQLWVTRGQLMEMISDSKQTDKLIEANTAQVVALEKAAVAAKASADTAKKQVEIADAALRSTIRQSQAALNASIAASRTDQRAWIGVLGYSDLNITAGAMIRMRVMISNSGKTPALKVKTNITGKLIRPDERFVPTYAAPYNVESASVIQPGASAGMVAIGDPFTATDVGMINDRRLIFYMYGKIRYEDIFKIEHLTTFCGYYDPMTTSFTACASYH